MASAKSRKFNKRRGGGRKPDRMEAMDSRPSKGKFDNGSSVDTSHKYNDVSWYTKNPQMLIDAASYSYNTPLGTPVPYQKLLSGVPNYTTGTNPCAVPGLMSISFVPTIGVSVDSISPANVAAQNIYSYVRYMNSGSKNYDQADLMLYMLAMDSLYMYWNWMKRIYGYLSMYSQYNKYMPRAYAQADGIKFDDFLDRIADFREYINHCASKLTAFCVPAVMPYFIRHSWMVSNIYKDSDTLKAQQYMFTPAYFYKYDETGSKFGGQLVRVGGRSAGNEWTLKTMQQTFEQMFQAVAYSEDVGVMSGDVLKAYGNERLFKLTAVTPDYTVEPVYNEEVLTQIHNLTIIEPNDSSQTKATLNITQDPNTGYLIYNPTLIPWAYSPERIMLNMPWDNIQPAQTMVASRLTASYTKDKLTACGSEFVNKVTIYTLNADATFTRDVFASPILKILTTELGTPQHALLKVARLTQFDWHPLFHVIVSTKNTSDGNHYSGIIGDINNYTIIDDDDVARMHSTALQSEFNIPQLGSF